MPAEPATRARTLTMSSVPSPGQASGSRWALVGWMLFVILFAYLIWFGGGYLGINEEYMRILSLGIVVAVLSGWALLAWRMPSWRPGTAIWPAFVIPLGTLALGTALSASPRLGIEYVAWSVVLTALYLLLVRILSFEFARARIGGLAAVLAGVMGVVYIAYVASRWFTWWDLLGHLAVPPLRPGYAGFTFGGPNHVASAVILLTMIAIAGLGLRTRARRLGLMVLVIVAAITVLLTASRSAWLGLAGASVAAGGLWLIVERRAVANRVGDRRFWGLIAMGFGAFLVVAFAFGPTVVDRLLNGGDGGRPSYFASAVRMFEDAPVFGLGPGMWAPRRISYLEPGDLDFTVPHAHNVILQTAAELGVVGLLAGLAMIVVVGWLVLRALKSADRRRRTWALAAAFGAAYMGIISMVDFYANLPGLLVLLAIPIAYLDGLADRGIGVPAKWPAALLGRLAVSALAVSCVLSIALLTWAESTAVTQARATDLANAGDWEAALAAADEAVAADDHPAHRLDQALAAAAVGQWDKARVAYQHVVAIDDLPQAWLGLALATQESGGTDRRDGRLPGGGDAHRQPAPSRGLWRRRDLRPHRDDGASRRRIRSGDCQDPLPRRRSGLAHRRTRRSPPRTDHRRCDRSGRRGRLAGRPVGGRPTEGAGTRS